MALDFTNIETNPNFIFQDEDIIVMLAPHPIAAAQLQVFPKEHHTILEQIPNKIVSKMFLTANKLSTVLFSNINCQGTNILVENGIPAGQILSRCSIHIIPRRENDTLNLMWKPQKFTEDQMSNTSIRLTEGASKIIIEEEKKPPKEIILPEKKDLTNASHQNLLLKQLKRMP
jgi:histidine triad (HIT) family protein